LLHAAAAAAQERPTFSETLDVHVVELDVSVTDRQGVPIRGLSREDFRLTLDGEEVECDHFAEIDGDRGDLADRGDPADLGDPADRGEPLSILFLVDSRTLRNASRALAFEQLRPEIGALLAPLGARARVVVYDGRIALIEDWTRDPAQIEAAFDRIVTGPATGESVDARETLAQQALQEMLSNMRGSSSERIVAMASIDGLMGEIRTYAAEGLRETEEILLGLQSVVRSLALTPGRKAIVYLTGGWAVRPGGGAMKRIQSAMSGTSARDNDPAAARVSQSDTPGTTILGDGGFMSRDVSQELLRGRQAVENQDLSVELDLLVAAANAYRVRFFPMMPPPGDAAAADARGRGRGAIEVSDVREGLVRLGEETGGLSFLSETSLVGALKEIAADTRHRYSLALDARDPGSAPYRELGLKVPGRGTVVRFPRLHATRTLEGRLLDLALAGLDMTANANPHRLELASLGESPAGDGRRQVQLSLIFPIERLGLAAASGLHQASSQIAVAVLDARGALQEHQHLQVPLQIPDADLEQARASFYRAALELHLSPGTHSVGIALWDRIAQASSVVIGRIEVGG
jgi:VWFA-related protein